jgi:hypothetical protein
MEGNEWMNMFAIATVKPLVVLKPKYMQAVKTGLKQSLPQLFSTIEIEISKDKGTLIKGDKTQILFSNYYEKEIEVAVSRWSPGENDWVDEEEHEQEVIDVLKRVYLEINELPPTWRIIRELPVSFQEDQTSFLNSLTSEESRILQSYTHVGDGIINQVLRGNVKTLTEESVNYLLKKYLELKHVEKTQIEQLESIKIGAIPYYVSSFMNIVKKSPVIKDTLRLYRGIKGEEHIDMHKNDIISTSYYQGVIQQFKGNKCCSIVINVKPGVRAVWIEKVSFFPEEREVIIIPPYQIEMKDTGRGNFLATISPYVRKAGKRKTLRRKNLRSSRKNK